MKLETDTARILGGVHGRPHHRRAAGHADRKQRPRALEGQGGGTFPHPAPGHADLTGALKYGYSDLRPALERASARETAARVAVGAVCRALLAEFGIQVGGYVRLDRRGQRRPGRACPTRSASERALDSEVSCPDDSAAAAMQQAIREIMQARDTLGGVIEVVALGLPPGLGSFTQWDRRLEARLGAAVLSVQAIKGVEFGPAFENARLPGTRAHDPIHSTSHWR